jgi:hypothetical protein
LATQDPHWAVRLFALGQARTLGLPDIPPVMIPLLLDEEQSIREEALRLLEVHTGQKLGTGFRPWYQWAKAQGMKVEYPERLREVR